MGKVRPPGVVFRDLDMSKMSEKIEFLNAWWQETSDKTSKVKPWHGKNPTNQVFWVPKLETFTQPKKEREKLSKILQRQEALPIQGHVRTPGGRGPTRTPAKTKTLLRARAPAIRKEN